MQKNKKNNKKNVSGVKTKVLRGKGDYNVSSNEFTQLQSKLDRIESKIPDVKSGFSRVGSKLGSLVGMSELGRHAGEGVSKLLGFGDYEITTNSLMKNMGGQMVIPKFDNNGNNGIRVREREFLGDIVSGAAGTFKNTAFAISPTNQNCFPWLSRLASQFDQWEPNGIVFEFISTSSDFNGSAQGLGSVIMATDYDVLDPIYTSKILMDNADYSSSQKPSINQIHGIECDPAQRPYKTMYCRSIESTTANRNTLGNFQIATAGVSASAVTLGELWISYDITLYKKQLDAPGLPGTLVTGNAAANSYVGFTVGRNVSGFDWHLQPGQNAILICGFPPGLSSGRFQVLMYNVDSDTNPQYFYSSPSVTSLPLVGSRVSYGVINEPQIVEFIIDYVPGNYLAFVASTSVPTLYAFSVQQVAPDYTF